MIQNALPRPLRLCLPSLGTGPYPCPGCCRGGWEGHSCLLCEPTCYWRPRCRLKGELSAGSARPEAGAGICQLICIFWEGKKKKFAPSPQQRKTPWGLFSRPHSHPSSAERAATPRVSALHAAARSNEGLAGSPRLIQRRRSVITGEAGQLERQSN